jgi:hypothetical protein
MKANELRIGNILMFTDFPKKEERSICGNDIAYAEKEPDWLDAFWTPITLTEELLLRFGFEINYFESEIIGLDVYQIHSWTIYKSGSVWVFNQIDDLEVQYIHSLQNLIYALTGQELELKP